MRKRVPVDRTPRELSSDVDEWERQPKESEPAWNAFVLYRDMQLRNERRSLRQVSRTVEKNTELIYRWSLRWRWVDRCVLYDRYLDDKARRALEHDIIEYRRRAAAQARGKASILVLLDQAIARKVTDNRDSLHSLKIEDLMSLAIRAGQALPAVLKAEALAMGDVTDRPEAQKDDAHDALIKGIRTNDRARSLLAAAVEQLGDGSGTAGGVRGEGQSGEVDESAAPDLLEPDTD